MPREPILSGTMPSESSSSPGHSGRAGNKRLFESLCCVHIALFASVFYFWTARHTSTGWGSRDPDGYYELLTAGFRSGHLYVPKAPHPLLLALADPYDPVANAPYRVHDMSLYHGHYYLYYGVTPVLILFWPIAAVTGWYVSQPLAVALFCTGAVWVGIAILLAARRRYFPEASSLALLAAAVCLAFATPLMLLVQAAEFYQVAISCAIFMQVLMLAALYRSLHSPRQGVLWLAAAGLFFGLTMGSRPSYIFGVVALLVPIAAAVRSAGSDRVVRRRMIERLAAFTFVPVGICAAGLMAYNWLRFGSATEFGVYYMLSGGTTTREHGYGSQSLANLLPNLYGYLFSPGTWQSYFPFFGEDAGQPFGLLRYLPWTWLALLPFVFADKAGAGGTAERVTFSRVLAIALLGNLGFLCMFPWLNARYSGDFANCALLLSGFGALALSERASRGRFRIIAGLGLIVGAAISVFLSFGVFFGAFPTKDTFLEVARLLNAPGYYWQRAHGVQFGGLRIDVRLPANPGELPEPLFETGLESDRRDWLQVDYPSPGNARLGLFHAGTGVLEGDEFPIPADRRLAIEVRSGSLIPPFGHPVFATWSREDYDAARRDLQVKVNGTEVLRAAFESYDSTPANLRLGKVGWPAGIVAQRFTGEIQSVGRLPLVKPEKLVSAFKDPEPVQLSLFLPTLRQNGAEPILLTGQGMESDLLYCVYDRDHQVRFALDHYGAGGPKSEPVTFDPRAPHQLIVCMSSLSASPPADRLLIVFDGRTIMNVRQHYYPSTPASAILGFNAFGSSAAGKQFTGRIISVGQVPLATLPAPMLASGAFGSIEMSVQFPYDMIGLSEPLVVTGEKGAGDFVYVNYVDLHHIIVGFDHWAHGGFQSDPIEVDYGVVHHIAVNMDSLYPAGSASASPGRVHVSIDGEVVLDQKGRCYPSGSDEIRIGENTIGGSTCGPVFSGQVLSIERFPAPRQ